MNNPIFDQPNHDCESLSPQERLRFMFQWLIEVATSTRNNKATDRESKDALANDIMSLQCNYLVINEHPLPDAVCRAWCSSLGDAYEAGQFSGMIDERAEGPAKFIRGWANQQRSVKARIKNAENSKAHALTQAKSICGGKSKKISQGTLADKIRKDWPEKEEGKLWPKKPSKKKLIEAISDWDKSGEIERNPSKKKMSR